MLRLRSQMIARKVSRVPRFANLGQLLLGISDAMGRLLPALFFYFSLLKPASNLGIHTASSV